MAEASLGIRQSPRGERATEPTLGPVSYTHLTSVGYIHTFEAAQKLEFDLWLYDGIHGLSAMPELRGLVVEYEIGGKQVEYYILFQVIYDGGGLFYGEDLSHLTPLEE